jgi:flagellar basal-body rod modification protein FlgD
MNTLGSIEDFQGFAPPPQQESRSELGQGDFLTLMITQFQNQDPFEPMDNGEFLGQLAQFSTVNGIESLNESFSNLAGSVQNNQALEAAGLVGRRVFAVTDLAHLGENGSINGAIELDSSASDVQIDITDSSGQLVQRLSLGQQASGLVKFSWDGIDASGGRSNTGQYQISARVIRGSFTESAPTVIEADIQSVTLGQFGQGMSLNLNGGLSVPLSQIFQIIG